MRHFNNSVRHHEFAGASYPASQSGSRDRQHRGMFPGLSELLSFFGQIHFFKGPQQLNNRISSEVTRNNSWFCAIRQKPQELPSAAVYGLCLRKHQFRLRFAAIRGNRSPWAPRKIKTEEEVCTHPYRSKPRSFIKCWKQQCFTLDRDEGCIILVAAASLGEHAPSIRSASWLTDEEGKGRRMLPLPCHLLRFVLLPPCHPLPG